MMKGYNNDILFTIYPLHISFIHSDYGCLTLWLYLTVDTKYQVKCHNCVMDE